MNGDHIDHILNVCLEEVLGGQTPPDLSARIMKAWEDRSVGIIHHRPAPDAILPPRGMRLDWRGAATLPQLSLAPAPLSTLRKSQKRLCAWPSAAVLASG